MIHQFWPGVGFLPVGSKPRPGAHQQYPQTRRQLHQTKMFSKYMRRQEPDGSFGEEPRPNISRHHPDAALKLSAHRLRKLTRIRKFSDEIKSKRGAY